MITEFISHIAVQVLEATTYAGAFLLMALESMIAPVPSEAVMPFVGFLVADGKWNLWLAVLATSAGSLGGSLVSYWMGYYGGKPVVLKVGKYLLLNRRDLEMTECYFQQRKGLYTVFVARFIPVVRHFSSIAAGMGRMPLLPFMLLTVIGATLWNGFLLYCGLRLREHWTLVQKYSHQVDVAILVVVVIAMLWFIRGRLAACRVQAADEITNLAEKDQQ